MVTGPYIVILLLLSSVGRQRMSGHPSKFDSLSLIRGDGKEAVDGTSLTAEKLILIIRL